MDQHIDSLNHPLAHTILTCLQDTEGTHNTPIVIEDHENIIAALQQGIKASHLIVTEDQTIPESIQTQLPANVARYTLKKRTAKKIFGSSRCSELFILAKRPNSITLSEIDHNTDMLVLDGLAITGNIGAICRSAAAFGIKAMVITRATVNAYDRRIIRASRGQVFRCPIISCTPDSLIEHCQQTAKDIVVLDAHATTNINTLPQHPKAIAMIFGSEKEGIDDSLQQAAAHAHHIPMHHALDSLNVSVAVGICLYQRHHGKTSL